MRKTRLRDNLRHTHEAMGALQYKTEGGQGGRRGHSNMDHWVTTAEIKAATRGRRRREAKALIAQEKSAAVDERKRP